MNIRAHRKAELLQEKHDLCEYLVSSLLMRTHDVRVTNTPPFTVPMRGSIYCRTSPLDFSANALMMPNKTLRGGLKLSIGSKAHMKEKNRAMASTLRRRGNVVRKGPAIMVSRGIAHDAEAVFPRPDLMRSYFTEQLKEFEQVGRDGQLASQAICM